MSTEPVEPQGYQIPEEPHFIVKDINPYVSGGPCPVCQTNGDFVQLSTGLLCTVCDTVFTNAKESDPWAPFRNWFAQLVPPMTDPYVAPPYWALRENKEEAVLDWETPEEDKDDYCVVCKSTDCRYDGMHPLSPRADMLREAERIVDGDRNNQYGDPRQDFQRTAEMWGAYLGVEVKPHDVAAMMSLLKISRIRWSPEKRDSWVDLAGYAACGWHCVAPEEDSDG